jgi:pantetheine-phosphate adenylyltransferase
LAAREWETPQGGRFGAAPRRLAKGDEIPYTAAMTAAPVTTARTALYAGSFDPLTFGHLDVMAQAAALFDRIVVAIGVHHGKEPWLSFEARAAVIRDACAAISSSCAVDVAGFDGLVVEAARQHGACAILRGLRDGADFDYEMQMAGMNGTLAPDIRTIFLPASPGLRHVSGTFVRQIAALGGDVSAFAPAASVAALERAVNRRKKT